MEHPGRRFAAGLAALVIVLYLLNLRFAWFPKVLGEPTPYSAGLLAIVTLYLIYIAISGDHAIWNAVKGNDGRASTSKFQVFVWTIVVLFSYVAIVAARIKGNAESILPETFPESVLVALGISIGTATAAAGITAGHVNAGQERKTVDNNAGIAPLVQTDDGIPDVGKIQLLAWTFVAVSVYFVTLMQQLSETLELPDIDSTLLVLTGLGSATYLGKKLITTTTTAIGSIDPPEAHVDVTDVTLTGQGFGGSQGGGRVQVGDTELQAPASTWVDDRITFRVPRAKPGGGAWTLGTPVQVRVHGPNGASANAVELVIQDP